MSDQANVAERTHRHRRNVWLVASVAMLAGRLALVFAAPGSAWLIGPSTWRLCLIGAAYEIGWLRRHREPAAVSDGTDTTTGEAHA